MSTLSYRRSQGFMLLFTIVIFTGVFYLQYFQNLIPCPLCMVQRFCGFIFALLCLMGIFFTSPRQIRIIIISQIFFSIAGLFFAGRQLWLQLLPIDQVPACLPGFDVLLRYFPWRDVLLALFWGTAECAEATPPLLGLSIPAWSALYFLILLFGSGFILIRLEMKSHEN